MHPEGPATSQLDTSFLEVLQVLRERLDTDPSFPERSSLQVEDAMELRGICLTFTCFQFEDKFYQQTWVWQWETRCLR
jgi:hypothetical protein